MTPRCCRAWLVVLLASGCSGDPYRFDQPRGAADVEIAPYEMREECVALDRGAGVDFYFVSTLPIAFSISYHQGNALILPVVREHATSESGAFAADHEDVYCLRWKAGIQGSILEYRLRPLAPR